MKIKKNDLIEINHQRKGVFRAIAERDFDTQDYFYPVILASPERVEGLITNWSLGEKIPCIKQLCTITEIIKNVGKNDYYKQISRRLKNKERIT